MKSQLSKCITSGIIVSFFLFASFGYFHFLKVQSSEIERIYSLSFVWSIFFTPLVCPVNVFISEMLLSHILIVLSSEQEAKFPSDRLIS